MVNKGFIFNIGLDGNTPGLEQVLFVTSQRFERRRNVRKLVRKITSVAGNEPHSGAVHANTRINYHRLVSIAFDSGRHFNMPKLQITGYCQLARTVRYRSTCRVSRRFSEIPGMAQEFASRSVEPPIQLKL
jgi:hypothetical protein